MKLRCTTQTALWIMLVAGSWQARAAIAQVPLSTPDNVLSLLRTKTVQTELELLDEQAGDLNELHARARGRLSSYADKGSRLPEVERKEAWAQLHREIAEFEAKGLEVLLPLQRKRLNQIVLQIQSRSKETAAGLTHKQLAEELKLSNEQSTLIRETAAQEEAKLQERLESLKKEVAKLKEDARERILSTLTREQRGKYHELLGNPIEVERPR